MGAKNVRSVKLCGRHDGRQRVPELRISGIWMDKLGFDIGRTIEITASEGKLIMVAKENEYKSNVPC